MDIEIKCDDDRYPYVYGDIRIARMVVKGLRFVEFAQTMLEGSKSAGTQKARLIQINRLRIAKQTTAYDATGKVVELDPLKISVMPWVYATKVKDALDDAMVTPGSGKFEILSDIKADGAGLLHPIHIKLGEPIKAQGGKDITEAEIQLKDLQSCEELLVVDNPLERAIAILNAAAPIGMQAMPSWAIDQISIDDGFAVVNQILPTFFPE